LRPAPCLRSMCTDTNATSMDAPFTKPKREESSLRDRLRPHRAHISSNHLIYTGHILPTSNLLTPLKTTILSLLLMSRAILQSTIPDPPLSQSQLGARLRYKIVLSSDTRHIHTNIYIHMYQGMDTNLPTPRTSQVQLLKATTFHVYI
jgi:hypothetical protein